jgi:hypothetical protein
VDDIVGRRELDGIGIARGVTGTAKREVDKVPDAIAFVAQVATEGLGILIGMRHRGAECPALHGIGPGRDTREAFACLQHLLKTGLGLLGVPLLEEQCGRVPVACG